MAAAGLAPVIVKTKPPDTFQWSSATRQSGLFLVVEQGVRLLQTGTRGELRGPWLRDYLTAVKGLKTWDDGDPWIANYLGHPVQGAVSGYIQVQNDPRGIYQEFGLSAEYWKSRIRATAWSALYSLNFELGPLGEAAIGNVGKRPGTMGLVDLVITPVGGLGWQVAEDTVDRYIVRWLESKIGSRRLKVIVRTGLNPSRAFANMLRGKTPWHRDTRVGVYHTYDSSD